MYITVGPAYGRSYKSKREVIADWDAGKDFICLDLVHGGRYINKEDVENGNIAHVCVRYGKNLTKVMTI